MTERIEGIAVTRGIAIGKAVLLGREPLHVPHYVVSDAQVVSEQTRLELGFANATDELRRLQSSVEGDAAYAELHAVLDLHAMLLEDPTMLQDAKALIQSRHYNAEWALVQQLQKLSREFDGMEDAYLRERKADLEQLVHRVLQCMAAGHGPADGKALSDVPESRLKAAQQGDDALIVVAYDLSPADLLQMRQNTFAGFVADIGGTTSHTAIVARSLDMPAVVGTRDASSRIRQDDWLIVHADAGVVLVNPDAATLAHYQELKAQLLVKREQRKKLLFTPAVTHDGEVVRLLANVELPSDCQTAVDAGAVGVGLFRSEFLFMGRAGILPDEQEQYEAYRQALEAMQGLPLTIRTVDIGADKSLDGKAAAHGEAVSALGLRAIRWSLAEPQMFRTQLRALLRAAVFGPLNILFPMLAQTQEIQQVLQQLELAREELRAKQVPFGPVRLGAMIEVPAAALMIEQFLRHFDFVSIGTNDLTQYTLAVDRADESVAHLFDATHPAVLQLIANVIAACNRHNKEVSLCGEMAGDDRLTYLLLGLGLRSFSMHPAQLLAVKERVLAADVQQAARWAQTVLASDDPDSLISSLVQPELAH